MDKDQLHEAAQKILFEQSGNLSREEYRELLEDIISDCRAALNALDEDQEEL
jgi:hypothetical protein